MTPTLSIETLATEIRARFDKIDHTLSTSSDSRAEATAAFSSDMSAIRTMLSILTDRAALSRAAATTALAALPPRDVTSSGVWAAAKTGVLPPGVTTNTPISDLWRSRPALIMGVFQAGLAVAVAFKLNITPDQQGAILGLAAAILGVSAVVSVRHSKSMNAVIAVSANPQGPPETHS